MKFKELDRMINDGVRPVVTGQKKIEHLENYMEPGMRARIVGSVLLHDDVVKLKLDFTEFDEYNKQFETSNYYDKDGAAVLTAREAGHYSLTMDCYVMSSDDMEEYLSVTEAKSLALLNYYKTSGFEGTYVDWLESQVIDLEARLQDMRESF